MRFDKTFDLTAGVYFNFYNITQKRYMRKKGARYVYLFRHLLGGAMWDATSRASKAALNTQSTHTELARDPHMSQRSTGHLAWPAAEKARKIPRPPENGKPRK